MDSSADRRGFLTRLAAAGVAASGVAAALPAVAHAGGQAGDWDDSWTARVRAARHKIVFDAPEPQDGLALGQAGRWRDGYQAALGAGGADVVPVVVLRHFATVLAFDDAIWSKYGVAEWRKIKHPTTGQLTSHNPFSRPHTDDERKEGGAFVEALIASGAIVLACNLAASALAGQMARLKQADAAAVQAEVRAGLVPGVILQPNGIYATARAQESGCVYMRST
jgi:hypothetical protein